MRSIPLNRRRHERIALQPMYTAVAVRLLDDDRFILEGHAYDISEGGVQFELDRAIAPGTPVAMQVFLPAAVTMGDDVGPGRAIFLFGNIVWLDDEEPGPARMALAVTSFARAGDQDRLIRALSRQRLARAA